MAAAFHKAAWIWRREPPGIDEFCDFLDTFQVPAGAGRRYYLHIAADSNYTAWLNGKLAAFGQYADYPDYKVYDRVDVTDFVMEGENRLVIVVWYYGINSSTYRVGEAGLIYELADGAGEVLTYSSENTLSRKSRDYISGKGDLISGQLGPTYHYDIRAYDGFHEAGCDGFAGSRTVPAISTVFHLRPIQKLVLEPRLPARFFGTGAFKYPNPTPHPHVNMQYAPLSYRFFGELCKGGAIDLSAPTRLTLAEGDVDQTGIYFIIDLGEETAGFLDIDIEAPHDCRIDVGFGEHLNDGRCRTSIRGFFCDIEAKAGRNQYLHTFRRFGCRYLQFFIHAHDVTVHYAGIRPTIYPFKIKEYKSGNLLRDVIYRVCRNTLIHCHHEHYEDCPWREQALYTMDSRNQMLCGYYAFGEYEAPRASLELISHGLRDDGLLKLCYPAGGDDWPIPAFSCMYFIQMEEYLRYSGDRAFIEAKYGLLEIILGAFLSRMQPQGVIENFYGGNGQYWNFYEWTPTLSGRFGETERRFEAPLNAFLSLALQSMAKIAEAIGRLTDAEKYHTMATDLNRAIAEVFYNPETGLFESFNSGHSINRGVYATLTQALCLLCGAAEEVDQSLILRVLASNGKDNDGYNVLPNTLSMNAFRFDALLAVNREKYAPVILNEIDRDYLYMLRNGATTFWETILGASDFGDAGSLCHGWSALPVYYYEILNKNGGNRA